MTTYSHTFCFVDRRIKGRSFSEPPFNFDLSRMEIAVKAPMHRVPTNLSTEEFIEWMKSKKTKD